MINVVKIGGNVIDNPQALASFLDDFAAMPSPKILVHGGGKEATRFSTRLGIETTMIEGRRVTDEATIEVVTMVYAGLINKRIVAMLQARGVNALGLCGADANLMPAKRRSPEPIDYGFVGDIDTANSDSLGVFLNAGLTPVVCAITRNQEPTSGLLLNSNADSVACAIASAAAVLEPTVMHYCFEMPGVMVDVNDPNSVIPEITTESFAQLKAQGIVHSGMIPKITGALKACKAGVKSVIIKSSAALNGAVGTVVRL